MTARRRPAGATPPPRLWPQRADEVAGQARRRGMLWAMLGAALQAGGSATPPPDTAPTAAVTAGQGTTALRTTAAVHLDGHLDEADWQRATPIDRFYETYP